MNRQWRSARLFGVLVVAAVPAVTAYALAGYLFPDWIDGLGAGTVLAGAALLTVGWAAVLAIVTYPLVIDESRRMVELARRGVAEDSTSPTDEMTDAQRNLAAALGERNRQIAGLAAQVRAAPIAQDAAAVAHALVAAARSITGDPTWTLAVLQDAGDGALPPGVYDAEGGVGPIEEVQRWAATVEALASDSVSARHAEGPWGAFVIVRLAAAEQLQAVLMAPWEGRAAPPPAELELYNLLGQHATTAIEHALLYARLRTQTDELNRLSALQTDFLRGVTHDLQTPLTSIRALAAELRDASGLEDAGRRDLDTIAIQADRLRRMVGQLLAVSRLEAGALTPAQEVFRAEPIVQRTWEALHVDRPMTLQVRGPDHLVVGDPDRLEQVLWAVLDNAVKYSPDGSSLAVELSADAGDAGLTSIITVRDEGAGMSGEVLTHAFDQFYRADDARRLSPDGSGVGLYAARGLLQAMGGDITAESRLGSGTTMRISMPAEAADPSV